MMHDMLLLDHNSAAAAMAKVRRAALSPSGIRRATATIRRAIFRPSCMNPHTVGARGGGGHGSLRLVPVPGSVGARNAFCRLGVGARRRDATQHAQTCQVGERRRRL